MSEPQTAPDHDFPVTPATSVMAGEIAMSYDKLKKKVEELQHQLETVQLQSHLVCNASLDQTRIFVHTPGWFLMLLE